MKSSSASVLTILLVVSSLVACAGPEPILKSNNQLQLYGKEAAEREASVCGLKAERAGLQHGTTRSGNAGAGALLGVVGGAAVGASTGLVGGPTGIAIGAAAGGAGRWRTRVAGWYLQIAGASAGVRRLRRALPQGQGIRDCRLAMTERSAHLGI